MSDRLGGGRLSTVKVIDFPIFFSLVCIDPEDGSDEMGEDEATNESATKSLRLSRIADTKSEDDGEKGVVQWTWSETVHMEDGQRQTGFLWMDGN